MSERVFSRNILLLVLAQTVFVSGSALNVTLGGIVGSDLAPSPSLTTLPVSLTIVGTALGTIPATLLMQQIGRRWGFVLAALLGVTGSLLAVTALRIESFLVFCAGSTTTGVALAFSQQFRFAAAESVPINKAALAISLVLLGSVGGAIIGPELIASGGHFHADGPLQGALIGAAALFVIGAILLFFFKDSANQQAAKASDADTVPLRSLLNEPLFLLAIAGGVVGQGIMAFIMTATPVSMHVIDGHSLEHTAQVIRAHVLAMYLPSFASGWLISRFGERNLMLVGVVIYFATLAVGLAGHEVLHYSGSMILLGVGWNFLFVGGTTLLVRTYHPSLRYRAQTINEFAVFGTSALGSLLAGTLISSFGWNAVLLSTLPALAVMAVGLVWLRQRALPTF